MFYSSVKTGSTRFPEKRVATAGSLLEADSDTALELSWEVLISEEL